MKRPRFRLRLRALALAALTAVVAPRPAFAGMPSLTLTDVARARFQVVSFFLMAFLVSAWGVQAIWNGVARDVPRLPRLAYGKAVGLVTLWGLLFVLVLTMISGARELMTPGAWEKTGLTYKLKDARALPPDTQSADAEKMTAVRKAKIERLGAALMAYARNHDGQFPPDDSPTAEIPEDVWRTPGAPLIRYIYVPPRGKLYVDDMVVAYEPGQYGPERFVVGAFGKVQRAYIDDVLKRIADNDARTGEEQ